MAIEEEFSIEIPDKEADAIHSGMSIAHGVATKMLTKIQWNKRSHTLSLNPMLTKQSFNSRRS